MLKKIYVLFLVVVCVLGWGQTTNIPIKNTDGTPLSSTELYCKTPTYNLLMDNFTSTGAASWREEDFTTYQAIINNTTGENDVLFPTPKTSVFSKTIDLGFDFKFYGKTYRYISVGSNGRIVLNDNKSVLDNLSNNAIYEDKTFSSPAVLLPSSNYNQVYKTYADTREIQLGQIFAGFTNLRSQATTLYKYKPVSFSGVQGMMFSFQNVVAHNGSGADYGTFTSNVILFADGRVLIYIKDKTYLTYNAILGVQNEDATLFQAPIHTDARFNYNNGNWLSKSDKVYIFTTDFNRTPTYEWKLERAGITTIESTTRNFIPNYQPEDGDKVSVKVTFAETSEIKEGSVIFKKIKAPVITKTVADCKIKLEITPESFDSSYTYKWFRDGVDYGKTGSSLDVDQTFASGNYYLKIDNAPCPAESNKIEIKKFFPDLKKKQYTFCDNSASPAVSKTVNLYDEFFPLYDASNSGNSG